MQPFLAKNESFLGGISKSRFNLAHAAIGHRILAHIGLVL
jgi:hypothetical protein